MFRSFSSFMAFILLGCIILSACTGCSINVVVAPHATLGLNSDLSQNATQAVLGGTADRLSDWELAHE